MSRPTRSVGRPPGPHDDTLAKLLPAALQLFLAEGAAALTPTRLHRETGVSRATIYRNWPEPEDLIEIFLERATAPPPDDLFTGELAHDLQAAVDTLLARFEKRPVRAFFAACLEYGRRSERMAAAAESFIDGILEPFHRVLSSALADGRLAGDRDDLVHELAGPLVLEHVLLGRRVTARRGREAVAHFLDHHVGSSPRD